MNSNVVLVFSEPAVGSRPPSIARNGRILRVFEEDHREIKLRNGDVSESLPVGVEIAFAAVKEGRTEGAASGDNDNGDNDPVDVLRCGTAVGVDGTLTH